MSEQYTAQKPLKDDEVSTWREASQALIATLEADLRAKDLVPDHAPELPPLGDTFDGFIVQPYRVMKTWIPDWSPNRWAGRHVVRVDTLVKAS